MNQTEESDADTFVVLGHTKNVFKCNLILNATFLEFHDIYHLCQSTEEIPPHHEHEVEHFEAAVCRDFDSSDTQLS